MPNKLSADTQLTRDRPLSHASSVQSHDLLIACIALLSADLFLALSVGQAREILLPLVVPPWLFELDSLSRLVADLGLRTLGESNQSLASRSSAAVVCRAGLPSLGGAIHNKW